MINTEKINQMLGSTTVSMTEANQNFSKITRLAEEEKAVVILKNNKAKFLVIDIDQIQGEPELTAEGFQDKLEEGIWVLVDASEPTKVYFRKKYPYNFKQEVARCQSVQKMKKVGDDLVVVNLTQDGWPGVYSVPLEKIKYSQEDGMLNLRWEKGISKSLLSPKDECFKKSKTPKLLEDNKVAIFVEDALQFEMFHQQLIDEGYVTQEEIDTYPSMDLPMIQINQHNELRRK